MTILAVILAAGGSRRLGRAKQLVKYRGEMLLARAVRLVCEAGVMPVVVLGAEFEAIRAAVDLSAVRVVRNESWEQGIASSIQAGLREAESGADGVMILTCDQPRLTAEHLRSLIAAFQTETIAASQYAGVQGVPAIFPRLTFAELYALSGDKGARALLANPRCSVVAVDFPGGEADVDTPEHIAEL